MAALLYEDNGNQRVDQFLAAAQSPSGRDILASTITTVVTAGTLNSTEVANYLNGTASCSTRTFNGSTLVSDRLPMMSFVGIDTYAGVTVNVWHCDFCVSGRSPVPSDSNVTFITPTAQPDLPFLLVTENSRSRTTVTFSGAVACKTGSLDPSLFVVPSGLTCRQI
jgi:hypothetical protein